MNLNIQSNTLGSTMEEEKSINANNNHFSNIKRPREAVSDDEEEKNPKNTILKKVDLLDIENSDDEF